MELLIEDEAGWYLNERSFIKECKSDINYMQFGIRGKKSNNISVKNTSS